MKAFLFQESDVLSQSKFELEQKLNCVLRDTQQANEIITNSLRSTLKEKLCTLWEEKSTREYAVVKKYIVIDKAQPAGIYLKQGFDPGSESVSFLMNFKALNS